MEESASTYAENGHNGVILEKKVQNSLSATTKTKRMQVKMDIRKHQEAKISKNKSHYGRKCKYLCRKWT